MLLVFILPFLPSILLVHRSTTFNNWLYVVKSTGVKEWRSTSFKQRALDCLNFAGDLHDEWEQHEPSNGRNAQRWFRPEPASPGEPVARGQLFAIAA
jgi:hypothetical protein